MPDDFIFTKADLINAREAFYPVIKPKEPPKVDAVVSRIVGRNILVNDSRLIALIVKWKKESKKPDSDTSPDNYFKDEAKVKELKEVFA